MADAGSKVLRGLLDVFLLESLEREPKHGYALLREMAEAFGTEPNRNRLYPLLGRMVRDGLIAERSDGTTTRTLYSLTDAGREALQGYRRLPLQFRARLDRIWRSDGAPAPSATHAAPAQAAPPAPARAPVAIPVQVAAPAAAPAGAPYPCPDARVALEKSPRTGALGVTITGCPMGAYEYCALCPVSQAVEGLRRLTFG